MSHRIYVLRGDESSGLGLRGRCLYRALGSNQEIGHGSRNLPPALYIAHTNSTLPRFASASNPWPTFPKPRACLMASPHHLRPANSAVGRLSGASSSMPTQTSTPAIDYPQAFTAEQPESARTCLRVNPCDFPDFSQDTLSGLILSETSSLTILSQLVRRLVTISEELSGGTQKLTALAKEKGALKEELHDLSSQIANLPLPQSLPPHQDISTLQSAIRDLSHRLTAPRTPAPPHPPSPKRPPPCLSPSPRHAPPRPPLGRGKRRPQHPPPPPQTPTSIPNTSSLTTTQSLARPSVIQSTPHNCSSTPMKPASSREGPVT